MGHPVFIQGKTWIIYKIRRSKSPMFYNGYVGGGRAVSSARPTTGIGYADRRVDFIVCVTNSYALIVTHCNDPVHDPVYSLSSSLSLCFQGFQAGSVTISCIRVLIGHPGAHWPYFDLNRWFKDTRSTPFGIRVWLSMTPTIYESDRDAKYVLLYHDPIAIIIVQRTII